MLLSAALIAFGVAHAAAGKGTAAEPATGPAPVEARPEDDAAPDEEEVPPEEPPPDQVAADASTAAQPPAPRPRRLTRRRPPPLRIEADFLRKNTDLRVRFGFNGYTPGPFSLFTAFAGWQEFGLVLDHGVANWKSFTIGVGGDAHYGQAWLLGALTQQIANYDDYHFRWNMWEAGGNLRTTFHWTELRGVDPYLFGALGAGLFHLDTRVKGWPLDVAQQINNPYLRLEAGGGLLWRIPGTKRFFVGAEARYLVTVQINPKNALDLRYNGQTATFDLFTQHKPPAGFSWVASVGVRL